MNAKRLLAGVALGVAMLSACQRDDLSIDLKSGVNPSGPVGKINLDSLRLAGPDPRLQNVVPITIHASADQSSELRAMQIRMVDRGIDYDDEYRPSIRFLKEDGKMPTIPVYLTLVKKNSAGQVVEGSVHNQVVYFTLEEGASGANTSNLITTNGSGKYNMTYKGNITLPQSVPTLGPSDDGEWYVMGVFNFQARSLGDNAYVDAFGHSGRVSANVNALVHAGSRGSLDGVMPVPFASNWTRLHVVGNQVDGTGYTYTLTDEGQELGERMHFKMLGVLLQIDEGENVYEESYNKFDLVVSNVLDFDVRFNFSPSAVKTAFEGRTSDGIGVPTHTTIDPQTGYGKVFQDFKKNLILYRPDDVGTYPLSSSDRSFPWDMPSLYYEGYAMTRGSQSLLMDINPNRGASYSVGVIPDVDDYILDVDGARKRYLVGLRANGNGGDSRRIRLIWAMPRETATDAIYPSPGPGPVRYSNIGGNATYIFSGTYVKTNSISNLYEFPLSSDVRQREQAVAQAEEKLRLLTEHVQNYQASVDGLIAKGLEGSDLYKYATKKLQEYKDAEVAYRSNEYRNARGSYTSDSTNYYGTFYPNFLKHIDIYAQPIVPLYQTNYGFRDSGDALLRNKVLHIQTLRTSDLMISEVVHHEVEGHNYSVVEIYNPNVLELDLSKYALVRLKADVSGRKYSFVKRDGSLTDVVTQAQILPFEALRANGVQPWANGHWSAFPQANSGTLESNRQRVVLTSTNIVRKSISQGEYNGKEVDYNSFVDRRSKMMLNQKQTMLLGASGYVTNPVTNVNPTNNLDTAPSWWSTWNQSLRSRNTTGDKATLRNFVAYQDASTGGINTLDMQFGDGFALIKDQGNGQWQIIDSTVPIGVAGWAFSGTYLTYREGVEGLLSTADKQNVTAQQSKSYAQRRSPYVEHPFIFPFRTRKIDQSRWSDDWNITDSNIYEGLGENGSIALGIPPFFYLKRTPWDTRTNQVDRYKQARPQKPLSIGSWGPQ